MSKSILKSGIPMSNTRVGARTSTSKKSGRFVRLGSVIARRVASSPWRRQVISLAIGLLLVLSPMIFLIQTAEAVQTGSGSVSLTTLGAAHTQDFNTLALSGTSSTLPTGWYFDESSTNANALYTAGTGSSNAGDTYSFGATGNSERAFGGLRSGTLIPILGASFTNNTGSTISTLAISYTGEQWRLGTAARSDRLDFQISTNATSLTTGTYTDQNALDFTTPNTAAAVGALDGNAAANRTAISSTFTGLSISNGATFFIRWTDLDASGADDGLAIDNFSLTPSVSGDPTATGSANPSTVNAGNSTLLTVNVTPGTNPASTGITVTGNLTSIGGSATQTFFDNATNGDVTAGDNIFSYQATVDANTTGGAKSLPITVVDAQARTASTNISLTVVAPSSPSVAGAANPATVAQGGSTLLTGTVTPGTIPTSTGLAVTGDLTSIGGSATQTFYDDGTHGDAVAGNNVFSFQATVSVATTVGSKTIPLTVTDAQSRSGSGSISLNVTQPPVAPGTIVVSQVYGGGGCGTPGCSTYKNDYIEIFNRSSSPVFLGGWSVQYGSATGTGSWSVTNLTNVTLQPGQYYLVQESGNANGVNTNPTADVADTIALAAGAGKVLVASTTTAFTGACPSGSNLIDLVGYGSTANCSETSAAPAPSTTTADLRAGDGCTDTDNNSADFSAGAPNPRNTSSPINKCFGPVVPSCPGSLSTLQGNSASASVSATDSDGTVTSALITSAAVPGITLDSFTPASGVGGTATATLNVANTTANGTYNVTIQYSNNDSPTPQTASCTVVVTVYPQPAPFSSAIKISQVYGGGGNSGSTYKNDFIELYNTGSTPVDITGWSVQYTGATAAFAAQTVGPPPTPLTTIIPAGSIVQPGHYFLIQESQGAGGTTSNPTADLTGGILVGSTAGKVALVASSAVLSGTCPTDPLIVDFIGYNPTATCSETSPTAPLTNTTAAIRKKNGCTDTNNNSNDFLIDGPIPRNSSSPANQCGGDPTQISGNGLATPDSVLPASNSLLTVNVTPASFPPSIGISVSGDLTSIGGPASQQFYDDATHGDQIAGDNIFSFQATVGAFIPTGVKNILTTITDLELRSATAPITLTVQSPTCGVERWSVKTGTDPDASLVDINHPVPTTIATLRALPPPITPPDDARVAPAETTVYVIRATMTLYKLETDVDYHIVVQDANGNTMITEIPCPCCVGASSPFAAGIAHARAEFDAHFTATTFFQAVSVPVEITGVGFFDFIHGQTGVAPNGIELHPILDIKFLHPPVAKCKNVTVSADASCMANASIDDGSFDPDAGDTTTMTQSPAGPYPLGNTTVTLTVADNHGGSSSCTAVVTVVDTTGPTISCPADKTVSCDASTDPSATGTATATDNCSTATLTHSDVTTPGSSAGNYTITRTWTATDASGNQSSCTQTITVQDTTAPSITCPANETVSCDASTDPSATGTATAADNCSTATVTHSDVTTSGSSAGNYTITRTWTATDASGNSSSCTQTITVRDTTAPTISCPANIVTGADAGQCSAVVNFTPTATDNCSDVTIVSNPPSGSTFPKGTTTVTSTATDAAGNSSSCSFTVTVNDTQKPVITCPANIVTSTDSGDCSAVVNYSVTAKDNCPGVTVVSSPPSGSTFPKGTTTVTSTATDASGNTASCSFTVTVNDTEKPTIACPADMTVTQASGAGTAVNFSPASSDNCPGVTTSCTTAPGSTFPVGTTHVMCTATDTSGNTASCAFNVLVVPPSNPGGSFVIGDLDAVVGKHVIFWGAQWANLNSLSGGSAPSSFKGFANSTSTLPPTCGGTWTSDPGNSSGPPGNVPTFIAVMASSSITKSGSTIAGNTRKMVIVRTDPGYDGNPGHAGTGTVIAVICH